MTVLYKFVISEAVADTDVASVVNSFVAVAIDTVLPVIPLPWVVTMLDSVFSWAAVANPTEVDATITLLAKASDKEIKLPNSSNSPKLLANVTAYAALPLTTLGTKSMIPLIKNDLVIG